MHRTSHAAIVSPRSEERRLAVVVLTSALPSGPGCGTDMVLVRRWRELARQADRPRAKVAQMTWQANATATYRFLSAAAARAH